MINGITYFKLDTPYEGDFTKKEKLSTCEMDNNFFVLESRDIVSVTLNEDGICLELKDGQKIQNSVDIDFDKFIKTVTLDFDKQNGILSLKCDDKEQLIDGFLTKEDVLSICQQALNKPTAPTGQYKPVLEALDGINYSIDNGEVLPVDPFDGDRYAVVENSEFGFYLDESTVSSEEHTCDCPEDACGCTVQYIQGEVQTIPEICQQVSIYEWSDEEQKWSIQILEEGDSLVVIKDKENGYNLYETGYNQKFDIEYRIVKGNFIRADYDTYNRLLKVISDTSAELKRYIDENITLVKKTISKQTDAINERISNEVDELKDTIGTQYSELNDKIDNGIHDLSSSTDKRISDVNKFVKDKINTLEDRLKKEEDVRKTNYNTLRDGLDTEISRSIEMDNDLNERLSATECLIEKIDELSQGTAANLLTKDNIKGTLREVHCEPKKIGVDNIVNVSLPTDLVIDCGEFANGQFTSFNNTKIREA